MFSIKLLIWLSVYFVFYILFSLNTLISIFCFIIIILLTCILLLQLQVEYLTFLILLLYLGGILIFFLFTTLMLTNEYDSKKQKDSISFENTFIIIMFFKLFFYVTIINYKMIFFKTFITKQYFNTYVTENYFHNNYISSHNDVLMLLSLYSEKYILLFLLGMILLFTMVGVIVITKNKHV